MLTNLLTITGNTFTETIRQPIIAVVLAAGILVLIFSPSLAMFTLTDDNQLMIDVGLSTLLVAGLFLASFSASTVITEEIERKTTLTVLTKSISRHTFIIGKYLGIAAAIFLTMFLLAMTLLFTIRHGVMQTARDEPDRVVIILGSTAAFLTILISLGGNYFYGWRFSSSAILLGALFTGLVTLLLSILDPHWQINPSGNNMKWELLGPISLTIIASLVLAAIATAAATRLNLIMTLLTCVVFFLLGIMVPYWLWPVVQNDAGISRYFAWAAIAVVPHLNFYVVSNAIYTETIVPLSYVGYTALYALLYVVSVLLFAIALFRSREIG